VLNHKVHVFRLLQVRHWALTDIAVGIHEDREGSSTTSPAAVEVLQPLNRLLSREGGLFRYRRPCYQNSRDGDG
jgi:hypothetical protein